MQPQYPAQYPQYPQQPMATPQPPYPPQGYAPAPQYYPPQPPTPTVAGTLDGFFDQPATGVKAWTFKDKPVGTTYSGIVARAVGNADIRQQTDQSHRPVTFKDGRPKFVMVVPMIVQPSAEFPEGQASWWVKGKARDELVRAMAEAGAPVGPPEAGAGITVTFTGMRPIPGMNPAFLYQVRYARPAGAAPVQPAQLHEFAAPTPAPMPMEPQAPNPWPVPVPQPAAGVTPTPAPTQVMPSNLSPEQQALLAQLTGG